MNQKTTQKSKVNILFVLFAFSFMALTTIPGFAQQSSFHANSQTTGKDLACVACGVTNAGLSVDADPDNYAQLNAVFGIAGGVWQNLSFPFSGIQGDVVEVVIGVGGGLTDFSVLGGLTLESFNGSTGNGDGVALTNLVNIELLPGTSDRYVVNFVAGAAFDRVRVKFASVVSALSNVRIYGARLRYGMPSVSGNLVAPGTSANLQLSPVSGADTVAWFAASEGGTPLSTGLNFTTPALNTNTTYYIEITRNGLTEPERYPVTVGIDFPPTEGALERVYACSQNNLALGGVQNPEAAVDGNPGTHSTFTTLKVGAFYQRLSFEDCVAQPAAGDALHIKLGTEAGLLEVLGFVGIQAVHNGVLVGDVIPMVNLVSVLNGPEQIEVVFTPSVNGTPIAYDGVQITKLSLDSFQTPLHIYGAYFYQPATGAVDVNRPVDVLWGTGGDIASTANFVRDVANAFDGDETTYAHLRANLSVLAEGVHITALYPTLSKEGDGVRVILQKEEGGLLEAGLLSQNIRIRTFNNNDANSELALDPDLISLSLLPGTEDVYELLYPVNVPFNRIEVSLDSGLASAFSGLYVYELDRAEDVPGGEFPDPVSPFHAVSQEPGVNGVCVLCDVVNPEFSVDADPDNYTELNAPLGVASGIWQDLVFPFGGLNGDVVEVEIGVGGGLADVSLLGGLTLESFNGGTANGDGISLEESINIRLVPGTTDRYVASFVAGANFDRVRVKFASVLEALTNVRIYGARLRYGMPSVSGNLVAPGTSANLQLSPVSGADTVAWFAASEGGTPLSAGLNFTTPALNTNTTYYIEITRNGLTEPERYPVTVGIDFPPTEGALERVYACSQNNLALGGVQNPEAAVDGNPGTHSTFTTLKVGAFYQRLSFEDCVAQPAAGDALHIKLGTEAGLLEVLGFVGIQAVHNGVLVGDVIPMVNLVSVLNGPEQIEVVFTPSVNGTPIAYDGVQITKLSLDSFQTPLHIYGAYFYQPATGAVDVNRPVDVLWGTGGDIASTANFVRDVANAFDGDETTYAHLRANLSVLAEGVHITALYPTLSKEGDGVRVILQKEEGGLLEAGLLSQNIRIRTFNNNDANSELALDPDLISLSLLPGTEDVYELLYPVNVPFNRIEVSLDSGLASAFSGLYIYELDRAEDVPGGEFPETGLWATTQQNGTIAPCVLCGITDPEYAVDADMTTFSQLNVPLGVGGSVWQELSGFPFRAQQGDHIQVVLGIGSGIIDASLLGGLTFQAMDGDVNVGEAIGLSNLLSVNLLPGTSDQYAFVFNPDAEFDKVRVEFQSLLAALTNVQVYGARIKLPDPNIVSGTITMPGTSTTVELSPNGGTTLEWFADAEGGDPIATGNSFTTPTLDENITYYIEISRDGFVDPQRFPVTVNATNDTWALAQDWSVFGGCLICNVTNPDNAADGDPATYAVLNQTAGVAGGIQMNLFDFPLQGLLGDQIQLVVGLGGGVIDASLFDGLTLQSFNGENANNDLADSAELINLQLLPGSTDQYVLTFTPGADFDRLQLNSSALVDLFSNLRIYGARIQFVKPNIVSGLVTTPGTSTTVVAEPVAETSLAWYDQPEGGTLLASGNELTTPELNANTTYYIQVSRDGFVEPERYPVTVMVMDAPVAGIPMVRVYADGQTNGGTILLSNVSNPGRAADGDKDTYSTMTLTAIGEVWQKLNFTTQQPGPDDPVHIKIGTNTGLLNLLSGLTLQAYNDNTAVGDPITLGSLIGLLNGADQADIVLPAPGVAYNSVRVRSAGIALGGGVNIYGAYFNEPGDNVDCDTASDILWGSEASLAGGVNAVDDPQNAIDGDSDTYAELHATVSVLGKTHITALYQMVSTPGDSVRIAFQNPGGLLDLGLLSSSLTVRTFLDNQDNGTLDLDASILKLNLLPGTSDIQVITYPIDVPFNRIQVSIGEGVATALGALRVYEVGRVSPSPVIAGGSDVTACVGEDVTLEVDFPTENVEYNWYDAETGGNLVGSGNPFTIEAVNLEPGTNTFYVSLSKNGCTDEASARTEVTVNVLESPEAPQVVSANVWAAPGGSATLQVLDPDDNITYNWYDAAADGELLYTGDTFEVTGVTTDVSYYVEAVAGESCISAARTEVTITVLMPPTIDPVGATITQGETVTFEGLSPDGTEVVWYDPDGNEVATGPEYTIPDNLLPGDYVYTATTRDPVSGAESEPVEIPVTVEPLVLNAPTVTPPSAVIDEGDSQTFTATHDMAGVTFTWYDPDGNVVATTPEYTTPANLPVGDYTYTVTATDPSTGVVSPPAEVPVSVQAMGGGLVPPTVTPPTAVIGEGDTQLFTASHDTPGVTYIWYDPDGNQVATTPEFTTPANLAVGDYTYTVTATDPDSGEVSDPAQVQLTVEPAGTLLPPAVDPASATIEEGETASFTASHDNPDVTFTWYDPDGNVVATTPEYTTPDNLPVGDHIYTVTVTDPDSGEESEPTEVVVTVEPASGGTLLPPTVTPPSATVMLGDTETFTASHDNPDVTFTWYDNDDNVVATTPEYTIPDDLAIGDYTYKVTVTDPDSGEESAPTEVPVSVVPVDSLLPPTVTPASATIEEGETETFTASHDNPDVTFTWYDPDGNVVATTPEYTTPDNLPVGDHIYTVTVTDPDSGEESEPTEVVVTVTPAAAELLPPSVDPLQATIDEGETAMFTASTDYPNGVIVWYDSDGNEVNIGEEFIAGVGLPAGTYTYNVVVRDPDTNEESTPVQVTLNILSVTPPLECLPAYERVYAGSQSASAAGVQNNANAIDGNLDTHSTIIAPSLGMTYYQQMNFGQSFSTGAGDELHVRIGTQVGLSVGSVTVTVRAYNGTTAVGTPVQLSSGVLLNLLSGENEADVVIPDPGTSFNAVRVSVTGGLISAGDIDIYAAYVNRAVETLAECVPVEDILVGSTSGVLGSLNNVINEGNVADGDLNTAANLRQNVGVAGYVHLTTLYSAPSVAGDSIRIVLADQNAGLLDLGLLSAIKVIAYKGNTPVHEATVDDGLLSLKLLGGANQYEVATQVDQPFDRISIQFDALVSALTGVDIFEIERVPVIQVDGNDPGDRAVEACQGGTVNLAAPTDDCTTYVWYDERNGGNLIGEGNLEFEIPADWTPGEHIVYVQPVRYGCEESGRTAVTIEVKEAPGADDIVVETDQPDYCENEEVVITATADALTTPVFAWYTDADKENPVADANGVTYTIVNGELSVTGLEAGTYTYYVSVKDGEDGCESLAGDLAEVSVVIKPGATAADIQTADQVICMGETAVLEASSTTISDPVFNWYDNEDLTGDAVFTGPVFEQNGLAAGLYTYYITVQNDDTCESTAEEAVAVTIAVQHQITSDDIVLPGDLSQCLGSPVALSAGINTAITVENPVFAWYFDAAGTQQITDGIVMDGATYTVNGADLTVEGLAEGTVINYYVSLDGDNVCGSLDGDLATVQVTIGNELEAPEVSETDVSVCEGDDAVLSVLNPQSNLQYNWYETETGGTAVFTGIEFTLTAVTQDAVYYVEAQGDGDCASLTRTEVTVTVKDYATAADITIDGVTEICEYDDLVLTPSTGIAAPVFRWYANADKTGEITDGVSADGVLTLSGLTEGTYTYYVSVASDELCENQAGDLAEVEVSVGSPQAAPVVSPPEQFVVVGETAAAFEVSGVTSGEVVWYNDEQLQTEVFRGTSYVPSAGVVGNYTYYVVIEEGACVSEVTQVILHVTDLPTPPEECYIADAQENGTTFGCVLCSVQNPTNAIDDDTDNFTRLSIPAGLGSGSVYQTLIFSHTGKAGDSVLVDIATPVGLGDINILGGITVTLFNGTTQVDQYSLENPLLEIRLLTGGQRGQVLIPASGAYDRVEIRNTAGVATLLQSVDIYGAQIIQAAPELDIPDPVELCEGEEYIVSATPAAGTVLRWYNSDDELLFTGSNFEIPSDVAGSFTYFIEVVDQASGCPSPDRIAFDVIVNDSPGADDIAVTGNEDPVCADDDVVLTPSSASGTVFRWYMDADKMQPIADGDSDGDVSYAIAANGVLTISGLDSNQSPYTYYVSVEGTNGCENPAGDLAVVNVEITPTVPEDNIAGIEIETTNGDGEVCLNVTPDVVIIATLTPGSTVTNPVFYWYDETGNMVAGGENGTLTLAGLTPGTYTYSVGVSGDGFCETAEGDRKNITFVARDDCQLINAVDDIASTPVDIPVTIDVLANDVAGESPIDPATVMIITAPGNGMVAVDPVTGMVTYAPASGYEGNDIFTYTVKDEDGFESNEATVTVTVGGDNGGLLAVDDSAATPEDIAVDIDVLANDVAGNADIDPTSVTIAEAPVSGSVTVNATTGVVTYTPASGYAGTDTFTYTMKDEDGYTSNAATVTVTVGGDNGGLLAVDDSASTPMEMPVAIDVLANDEAGNSPIDLTSVTIVTMPGEGTVTVDAATGVVTYTSSGDFEGDDTFTYTMKDEAGYTSNEATVTVSVGGDNGGLLAVDDSAATPEDIAVDIDVLANDVAGNADIDPTSVTIAEAPVSGSVTVNATTGVVTYTPASGYAGTDTFTYTMKDEDGYTSNAATVTVTVGGDNGGLLAVDDSAATPMEMPVAIDVLANDEAGNSPIDLTSVTIVTMPGEGTVTVDAATGVVTYTSSGDFEGDDTFTYTMKDEAGYTSNEATVTVSVGGDNGGLLAIDDSAATPEDIAVDIDVLANDVAGNADIDPTSVTIAEAPVSGSVTVNATTGVVTYTPASGYAGTDTFTYTMKDEDGYTSNAATVTVTVGGDNGGLLAVDDSASTPMEMPVAIDVLANDEA